MAQARVIRENPALGGLAESSGGVGRRTGPDTVAFGWKQALSMSDSERVDDRRSSAKKSKGTLEKNRSGAEKRRVITEAAIQVFAEKGYHGTRISDIAKRAEVAYGLVYHYFKNKEEILDTIFFESWGEFINAVRGIKEDGRGIEDKLLSVAAVILSAHRTRPEWVKVLIFEIQRTQRFADPERMEVVGELFRLVAEILQDGQQRGELREDLDARLACYVFIGGLDIVVTSRVLDMIKIEGDERAYFVRMARTVVDLFLNGMARAGE